MATSFIGKAISLLSHSDVRYRGILAGLDPANSTIQLRNVYSMGTENRRPPEEFIPPAEQPYQYIIFRASEVKDIALDNNDLPAPRTRSVHDDPAVLNASAPSGPPIANGTYAQYYPAPVQPVQPGLTPPPPQQVPTALGARSVSGVPPKSSASPADPQPLAQAVNGEQPVQSQNASTSGRTSSNSRRANNNSVSNAAVSMEKVERALGDLRLSNAQDRSRRSSGRPNTEITVPNTDFDFQSSNARFDKAALASRKTGRGDDSDANTNPSDDEKKSKSQEETAYNPKKSFFDTLSSSTNAEPLSIHGGRGGRRGGGKSRREEEREKNVATFGEPGGVGLMGPGAYVGGYGGYGRRGGGRGARRGGGGRRGAAAAGASATTETEQ